MSTITQPHKERFNEIRKKLGLIGSKESTFITVELLFYEAINISRTYGNDENDNKLLAAFKELEGDQYRHAKEFFRKSSQREYAIRQFIFRFKTVLAMGMKNILLLHTTQ